MDAASIIKMFSVGYRTDDKSLGIGVGYQEDMKVFYGTAEDGSVQAVL